MPSLPLMWKLAVAAPVAAATLLQASPAVAADLTDAGDVLIVEAADRSKPLTEGDAASSYIIALPKDAVCPGDSYNDNWRIESFIVPEAEFPDGITRWRGIGPAGADDDNRWTLYFEDTTPFSHEFTSPNEKPGQPGVIPLLPPMTMKPFDINDLPPGRYRMGIACSDNDWNTGPYWDTTVDVQAAEERTGGLRWEVVGGANADLAGESDSNEWILQLLFITGITVFAGAVALYLKQRRDEKAAPLAKEPS